MGLGLCQVLFLQETVFLKPAVVIDTVFYMGDNRLCDSVCAFESFGQDDAIFGFVCISEDSNFFDDES